MYFVIPFFNYFFATSQIFIIIIILLLYFVEGKNVNNQQMPLCVNRFFHNSLNSTSTLASIPRVHNFGIGNLGHFVRNYLDFVS